MVYETSKGSEQPAHTRSLIRAFASRSNKILTEHDLEFVNLKGGCTGLSESTHVKKMPHCWKSYVAVHLRNDYDFWKVHRIMNTRAVQI